MEARRRTYQERMLLMAAGEYLVAGQLRLRKYMANLTPRNYPAVDIYAYNLGNGKGVGVQVKTAMEGGPRSWVIGRLEAVQRLQASEYPFVFVWVTHEYEAEFYVAKALDIARSLLQGMQTKWSHLDPTKQVWAVGKEELADYKNRWDLLGLD
jgi:hypothetical protein